MRPLLSLRIDAGSVVLDERGRLAERSVGRLSFRSRWGQIDPAPYSRADLGEPSPFPIAASDAVVLADEWAPADAVRHEYEILEESWASFRSHLLAAGYALV